MFKNISNLTLIIILAALLAAYLAISHFSGKSRTGSFRTELVEIDTAKATSVKIAGGADSVRLDRVEGDWKVRLASGKAADAEDETVARLFSTLLGIQPSRIATKDEDKWKDYQVDTAGTRVQVFEGDAKSLDLIVGRFGIQEGAQQQPQYGMQGSQQFYTYVRLADEPEVYAADNFMGYSLSPRASSYRDDQILSVVKDSVAAVAFSYPSDSSFRLTKAEDGWAIDGQPADSAAVAAYLNDIRRVSESSFADNVEDGSLSQPEFTAEIEMSGSEDIRVQAYRNDSHTWIVHSSQNAETWFADQDSSVVNKVFRGRNYFQQAD